MKKLLILIFLIVSGINLTNAQAPSIASLVKAVLQTTSNNVDPIKSMLETYGYTFRFSVNNSYSSEQSLTYVYSKNCKVIHEEYGNGLEYTPSPESAKASIIKISTTGNRVTAISIDVYSNQAFKTWISQLKALGYRTTSDSGAGNRGQSWEYVASGKPKISIWNDYSTTYSLSIYKK